METTILAQTEKHQRALAIARRMMQNKRQVQAETLELLQRLNC